VITSQQSLILARTVEPKEEFIKVEKSLSVFSISTTVTQRVLPPEERKISRAMMMLKDLIKNSERDGTWGAKPHAALFRGEYLHTL